MRRGDADEVFKLAWDICRLGIRRPPSAIRKFFAGAPFMIRHHSYRETHRASFTAIVDKLMAAYDYPAAELGGKRAAE